MVELRKENKLLYIYVHKVKERQIWNTKQITLVEMKIQTICIGGKVDNSSFACNDYDSISFLKKINADSRASTVPAEERVNGTERVKPTLEK